MAALKTNELGELILKVLFTGEEEAPTEYYLGLGTGDVPTDPSTTLLDIEEVTGPGYARQLLERGVVDFPALSLSASGYSLVSLYKSFEASGPWDEITWVFLATSASGTSGRLLALEDVDPFQATDGDAFDLAYQHTEYTA